MASLCVRMCPYPFFEATPLGAAPDPRLKPGSVSVSSGGVTTATPALSALPPRNPRRRSRCHCPRRSRHWEEKGWGYRPFLIQVRFLIRLIFIKLQDK